MFEFDKFSRRTLAVAAVCISSVINGGAIGLAQAKRPSVLQLEVARKLLEAAFPDLIGSDARARITLESPFNWEWLLSRHIMIQVEPNQDATDQPFLRADLEFDRELLREATFIGRRVNSARMEALTADAEAHPEWQEQELATAMSAAGAKFGPDRRQAFIDSLQWKRFVSVFGSARTRVVTFSWRLGRPDLGSDDVMTPSWVVKINVRDSLVTRGCYVLIFEPLDGNLRSVINGGNCP